MSEMVARIGWRERLRRAACGQAGQTLVEYTLLLVVIGIPMIVLARKLLAILSGLYGMVTFVETLPLP
jgi:Flp pilus assembly pilin Flp